MSVFYAIFLLLIITTHLNGMQYFSSTYNWLFTKQHTDFSIKPVTKKAKIGAPSPYHVPPQPDNICFIGYDVSNDAYNFGVALNSQNDALFSQIEQDGEQFSIATEDTSTRKTIANVQIAVPCAKQNLSYNAQGTILLCRNTPTGYLNMAGSKVLLYNIGTQKAVNIDASNNLSASWHPTENLCSLGQIYELHENRGRISISSVDDNLTTKELFHVETDSNFSPARIRWVTAAKAIATITSDSKENPACVSAYDYHVGKPLSKWTAPENNRLWQLASNNQDSLVATNYGTDNTGTIVLVDIKNGQTTATIATQELWIDFKGWYNNYLAFLEPFTKLVKVYDQRKLQEPVIIKKPTPGIAAAQLSNDGAQLAVLDQNGIVEITTISSTQSSQQKVHGKLFFGLKWSAKNKHLLVQTIGGLYGLTVANWWCNTQPDDASTTNQL